MPARYPNIAKQHIGATVVASANETIILRHAEDAVFLWSTRRRLLRSNELTHAKRAQLDMRLSGHIAGLRIAGDAGWNACLGELESTGREAGAVFASAVLALGHRDAARVRHAIAQVTDEATFSAAVSAIGWCPLADVRALLESWLTSDDPGLRRLGLGGLGAHRCRPQCSLAPHLADSDTNVQTTAIKVAGELGAIEHRPALKALLRARDESVRFNAARALARFGDDSVSVQEELLALAEARSEHAQRAISALVHLAPANAGHLFRRFASDPRSRQLAVTVADTLGDPELVPDLVSWMDHDEIARGAGDAFCSITGADVVASKLSRARPARIVGDPTDDPEDERVELDDEYGLPFLSSSSVSVWWNAAQERFCEGTRYLGGRAVGHVREVPTREHVDNLRSLIKSARPRSRRTAALFLSQSLPAASSIEVDAPETRLHPLPGW